MPMPLATITFDDGTSVVVDARELRTVLAYASRGARSVAESYAGHAGPHATRDNARELARRAELWHAHTAHFLQRHGLD